MSHTWAYRNEVITIAQALAWSLVDRMAEIIKDCGTLYIVGLGGSAANASHMAADFRKLCQVDARCLDSMAEVTARANDEGWETIFDGLLRPINSHDALFVLSVGGGTSLVSTPLVKAVDRARGAGAHVLGVVGSDGGYTARHADVVIKIPAEKNLTPHTEAFQATIWHCLVSHPLLQKVPTKW